MPTTLPLDQLIADPSVHPRNRIRQGTIRQYAASYKEGDALPPVDVFKSPDGRHFLADGFHRYYGARAAGHFDIAVTHKVTAAARPTPNGQQRPISLPAPSHLWGGLGWGLQVARCWPAAASNKSPFS